MLHFLALLVAPAVAYSFNVSFPVRLGDSQETLTFEMRDGQHPVTMVRNFCANNKIAWNKCAKIRDYLLNEVRLINGHEVDDMLCGFEDDVILRTADCVDTSLVWGTTQLYIDLSQLGSNSTSAELNLPAFVFDIEAQLQQFCAEHNLSGQRCRQLDYEVINHITSLYERPEGLTLASMLTNMYFYEEMNYFMTHVDYLPHGSDVILRYFFVETRSYFTEGTLLFCAKHGFDRPSCTLFVEHVRTESERFFGEDRGELWCLLYIMRSINVIVEANKQALSNNHTALSENQDYVVADFIEIGTSNFNTLTQLVDTADGLVGYAVEPSLHYLSALPDKPGITKANCAIVSAADVPVNSSEQQFVDLYHIPEKVIDEENLVPFLKGCNSVGRYHPYHVEMNLQHYVQVDKVYAYTVEQFLAMHRIRRIRLLKIDAEGYDVVIMEELYQYLLAQNNPFLYPERIVFETNDKSQADTVQDLIRKYTSLGYQLVLIGTDTILQRLLPQ